MIRRACTLEPGDVILLGDGTVIRPVPILEVSVVPRGIELDVGADHPIVVRHWQQVEATDA